MFGIYLHIPFCAKKCTYCDFHFSTTYHDYRLQMVDAMAKEIEIRAASWQQGKVSSIYFGGGTPSLLNESELKRLFDAISNHFQLETDAEITLECNPDDCTESNLVFWKKLGINRLSIGVQSFEDRHLQWMNRTHSGIEGKHAIQIAIDAGFQILTADLIYGLPGMTLEELKKQVDLLSTLGVNHISAYCLTVERKTALDALVKSGQIKPSSVDEQSEQFLFLIDYLGQLGYEQYEISNFAKEGAYAVHNSNYWKGIPYLGIGPSAHGFDGKQRYWNISNNHKYMHSLEQNKLDEEVELLSQYDQFNESILIGLRTKWGVSLSKLYDLIQPTNAWKDQILLFINNGLMIEEEGYLKLTPSGKLQADGIAADLFILESQ